MGATHGGQATTGDLRPRGARPEHLGSPSGERHRDRRGRTARRRPWSEGWWPPGCCDVTTDLGALDGDGLVGGGGALRGPTGVRPVRAAPAHGRLPPRRHRRGEDRPPGRGPPRWTGQRFGRGVEAVRAAIAAGDVYQVNLTRRLSAPVGVGRRGPRPRGGAGPPAPGALRRGRRAPRGTACRWPRRRPSCSCAAGDRTVRSSPIKGTAPGPDRVHRQGPGRERHDRRPGAQRPRPGVRTGHRCTVPALLAVERHPGLAHLVSTVEGRLRPERRLGRAPRRDLPARVGHRRAQARRPRAHPPPRGRAPGPVLRRGRLGRRRPDGTGELNVAIRTFWIEEGRLCLGTGGAITWDSTPDGRVGGDRAQGRAPCSRWRPRTGSRREPAERSRSGSTGALRRADAARLDPSDHGLLLGDGVFETLRATGGRADAARRPPRPPATRSRRPSASTGSPTTAPSPAPSRRCSTHQGPRAVAGAHHRHQRPGPRRPGAGRRRPDRPRHRVGPARGGRPPPGSSPRPGPATSAARSPR